VCARHAPLVLTSITIRPAGRPPIVMSKNTCGRAIFDVLMIMRIDRRLAYLSLSLLSRHTHTNW
jgi:hypothetical protein